MSHNKTLRVFAHKTDKLTHTTSPIRAKLKPQGTTMVKGKRRGQASSAGDANTDTGDPEATHPMQPTIQDHMQGHLSQGPNTRGKTNQLANQELKNNGLKPFKSTMRNNGYTSSNNKTHHHQTVPGTGRADLEAATQHKNPTGLNYVSTDTEHQMSSLVFMEYHTYTPQSRVLNLLQTICIKKCYVLYVF